MEEIKLKKPLLVNGKDIRVLTCDPDGITNDLYLEACMKSSYNSNTPNMAVTTELDKALHLQLGKAAILAANPKLSWSDLDRITGFDLLAVANVGRFFTLGKSEEDSKESSSEKPSETMAESTTQALQTSESGD